jgi:hypothetical protein
MTASSESLTAEGVTPFAYPLPDTAACTFCRRAIQLQPAKVNPNLRVWLHMETDQVDCS